MLIRKCPKCGRYDNVFIHVPITQNQDGTYRFEMVLANNCPYCGSFYKDTKVFYKKLLYKLHVSDSLKPAIDLFLDGHRDSAIREASIILENLIRDLSGLDEHGANLAVHAFSFSDTKKPLISLNNLNTESERNEQRGMQLMLQGFFMCIRNIAQHNSIGHGTFETFKILCFVDFAIKIIQGHSFTEKARWVKGQFEEPIVIPKRVDRLKLNMFMIARTVYEHMYMRFVS